MEIPDAILRFCNYQERCHQEVRTKLSTMYFTDAVMEEIISDLIRNDLLNEERFARAFARGKFKMLEWGRVKIKYELKKRQISEYCIKKGLSEIDEDIYESVLNNLFEKKWAETKRLRSPNARKGAVLRYMLQKGYESDFIMKLLRNKTEKK